MVLPTNCDEAPRFATNLQFCLCEWAASTVLTMGSIPAARTDGSFNSWRCWWIEMSALLSVSQDGRWMVDGVSLVDAQNTWFPAANASLSTRPCLHTSNPQTQLGARVRQQHLWEIGRTDKDSCLQCKLSRRCSIIDGTEVIQPGLPCISGPRSALSKPWIAEYPLRAYHHLILPPICQVLKLQSVPCCVMAHLKLWYAVDESVN